MVNIFGNFQGVGGGGGYRVLAIVENPKGWGGGGSYMKFPLWWGYGYFLELRIADFNGHCNSSKNWWSSLHRMSVNHSVFLPAVFVC